MKLGRMITLYMRMVSTKLGFATILSADTMAPAMIFVLAIHWALLLYPPPAHIPWPILIKLGRMMAPHMRMVPTKLGFATIPSADTMAPALFFV